MVITMACSKNIVYYPKDVKAVSDVKEIIKRVLDEQPRTRHITGTLESEVTDTYFSISRMNYSRNPLSGEGTTFPSKTIVYYDDINTVQLYKKVNYIIRILDKNGSRIIDIYSSQLEKSQDFIDALYSYQKFKVK